MSTNRCGRHYSEPGCLMECDLRRGHSGDHSGHPWRFGPEVTDRAESRSASGQCMSPPGEAACGADAGGIRDAGLATAGQPGTVTTLDEIHAITERLRLLDQERRRDDALTVALLCNLTLALDIDLDEHGEIAQVRRLAHEYRERCAARAAELEQNKAALAQLEVASTAPASGQPERVSPPPGGAGAVGALDRGSR